MFSVFDECSSLLLRVPLCTTKHRGECAHDSEGIERLVGGCVFAGRYELTVVQTATEKKGNALSVRIMVCKSYVSSSKRYDTGHEIGYLYNKSTAYLLGLLKFNPRGAFPKACVTHK